MNGKLSISTIIQEGIKLGLKNFLSLIVTGILYLLTFWIPYLNVGTTIAVATLPLKMSEGKAISPTEIFNSKYRKNMGEFLLLIGLLYLIVMMGYMFIIIPGIVMSIAYGYSIYFLIDKEVTPTTALNMSNKATYGYKWNIFLSKFVFTLGLCILNVVCTQLGIIGYFIIIAASILVFPILLGMEAHIYKCISNPENSISTNNNDDSLDADLLLEN